MPETDRIQVHGCYEAWSCRLLRRRHRLQRLVEVVQAEAVAVAAVTAADAEPLPVVLKQPRLPDKLPLAAQVPAEVVVAALAGVRLRPPQQPRLRSICGSLASI